MKQLQLKKLFQATPWTEEGVSLRVVLAESGPTCTSARSRHRTTRTRTAKLEALGTILKPVMDEDGKSCGTEI